MKKLGFAIILCLSVMLGAVSALIAANLGVIDLKKEITAGNAIQGAATILTGVLVALVIQKFVATDRKEKDILLSYMDQLIDDIAQFEATLGPGVLTDINAALKKCSMRCNALMTCFET